MEIYRESWETSVGNICTNLRKQILGGDWDTKRGEKLRADDMTKKNIKIFVQIWEKQILGRHWDTKRGEK